MDKFPTEIKTGAQFLSFSKAKLEEFRANLSRQVMSSIRKDVVLTRGGKVDITEIRDDFGNRKMIIPTTQEEALKDKKAIQMAIETAIYKAKSGKLSE